MRQTAVEWLILELTEVERNLINKTFLQLNNSLAGHRLKDIFEQAKELEKQQIVEAYDLGMGHYGGANRRSDAEQYYTETYETE